MKTTAKIHIKNAFFVKVTKSVMENCDELRKITTSSWMLLLLNLKAQKVPLCVQNVGYPRLCTTAQQKNVV